MDNSNKTKFVAENDVVGFENWLMDPGATSHVAKTTKKMFILKTAIDGECVTVGSNKTLKATAIKGVLDNHAGRLISVWRYMSMKKSLWAEKTGQTTKFYKETDGLTYLKARCAFQFWRSVETRSFRKFGHMTEKLVQSLHKSQGIEPTGEWAVCRCCARVKATQKRTDRSRQRRLKNVAKTCIWIQPYGPYTKTVAGSQYLFKIATQW